MKTFVLAGLLVILGPDFTQMSNTSEPMEGLIPGTRVVEDAAHWQSPEGDLYGFCFRPYPARDRGPMVAVESWKVEVAGTTAELSRTSMFFGVEQEVLVAHWKTEEAQWMFYSPNLSRGSFEEILSRCAFSP